MRIIFFIIIEILYFFLMITDIPGRRPSNFFVGLAFTSKVFRSYWPFDFVAFHVA
jgi:hypothetical protein